MGEDALFFETPAELRAWLEEHHATASELWVGYYKKASGRRSLTWSQVVDEALCFGWIDGKAQRIDENRYRQRLTPRKANSNWSGINIAQVAELRAEGRITPAGEAAFAARREGPSAVYSYERIAGAPWPRELRCTSPRHSPSIDNALERSSRSLEMPEPEIGLSHASPMMYLARRTTTCGRATRKGSARALPYQTA
jgi:hypothetical protein